MQGLQQWTWDEGQGLPPDTMGHLSSWTEEGGGGWVRAALGEDEHVTWITEGRRRGAER